MDKADIGKEGWPYIMSCFRLKEEIDYTISYYLEENVFSFNMTKGVETYKVENAFSGNPEISKKEEALRSADPFPFTELKREK